MSAIHTTRRRVSLVFTGRRRNQRLCVLLQRHDVWLPGVLFEAVCRLACAKARGIGFVAIDKMTVYRLRKAVAEQAGETVSANLIEAGPGGEYRLMLGRDQIAYEAAFLELPAHGLIHGDLPRVIRRAYRRVAASIDEH